jgi:hypothetical protein
VKFLRRLVLILTLLLFLPSLAKAGELNLSFSWPLKGEILVGFGEKGSEVNRHLGVDISSPPGSKILSPASGKVVFVGKTPKFYPMYTVSIEVAEDVWTTLSPLEEVFVKKGVFVKEGEEVGLLAEKGDSSSSPLPHLHWGLKIHSTSQYLNPLDYISSGESLNEDKDPTLTVPLNVEEEGEQRAKERLTKESLKEELVNGSSEISEESVLPFSPSEKREEKVSLQRKNQMVLEEKKFSAEKSRATLSTSHAKGSERARSIEEVSEILMHQPPDREIFAFTLESGGEVRGEERQSSSGFHESLFGVSILPLFISFLISLFTFPSFKREEDRVCLG